MSVISRPNELALVTGRPSITQLYALCVWPVTNRSTSSVVRLTMSTIGPAMPVQPLIAIGGTCAPPSCSSTTIASTPRRRSSSRA